MQHSLCATIGDRSVYRLGFGALHLSGPGFWGEPEDRLRALDVLRAAVDAGVELIDTADSYGPEVSERLIREALFPYSERLVIATKAGLVRPEARRWVPLGRPEYLMQAAKLSARRLGLDTIPLWQLHRIDAQVPRDEQFDAIRQLRAENVIAEVGLSEVTIEEIEAARRFFPVAAVQNNFSVFHRRYESVLDYCDKNGIVFLAFFPFGKSQTSVQAAALERIARIHGATAKQISLAWLLRRSAALLPIPGTRDPDHLRENMAAATINLSDAEFDELEHLGYSPVR